MKFIADFHIHSKYSRATARNLDLENLYVAAQIKGLSVIGTGDFTHPACWQELNDKLVLAQEGLFALKPELARTFDARVPPACRRSVRFVLVTEISNIYKKDGRTRKNHNLVFLPEAADGIDQSHPFDQSRLRRAQHSADHRVVPGTNNLVLRRFRSGHRQVKHGICHVSCL